MRYFITAVLIMTTVAMRGQSADVDSLKMLNAMFIHGTMTRDTAKLKRIFAPDFVLINPSGRRRTGRDVLNGFVTGPHFLSSEVDTVEIRLYGTIGLVLARAVFTSEDKGKKTTGKTDYLDVYEKRNGRWVAIAAHVTYLGDN
jgi:uncharacterized protein (TIGR02246 family)